MKIVFLLWVMLNLCLVLCQRNLDFGLMLTLEDLIVGQIHWKEKYNCSCFYNIDDVPSQGSPVMRNDTAMMYYITHHHVICDMHIPQSIIFSNITFKVKERNCFISTYFSCMSSLSSYGEDIFSLESLKSLTF